jgi:hypothetical protein
MQTCRLHVTGASGAGVTTLGRALADALAISRPGVRQERAAVVPRGHTFAVFFTDPGKADAIRPILSYAYTKATTWRGTTQETKLDREANRSSGR